MELYRRNMPGGAARRLALEPSTPYLVVVQILEKNRTQARFITAYIVDSQRALKGIRSCPNW